MNFQKLLSNLNQTQFRASLNTEHSQNIPRMIENPNISFEDFLLLLSPAAAPYLDMMAQKAQALTAQYFGRTIHLYVPVYLSNECTNECLYCGFNKSIDQQRTTLSVTEMRMEFKALKQQGFDHVLLLTGEAPNAGVDYLVEAIKIARQYFTQISLEIFPASTADYQKLIAAGASGLTIYQETFDRETYRRVHLKGKKADYDWRLNAPQRALEAGFRRLGLGVLLGLSDWRLDTALLAYQAQQFLKTHWQSELSISFPRLHHTPEGFQPQQKVDDRQLLQIIFALRLFLPQIGLVLSTRESSILRDNMLGLGITQISAGSRTNPGGYQQLETSAQFTVEDQRELKEVISKISSEGFDPVLKDWEGVFA
ncbi:2-iminoacetate synthase ThiH [Candidatus Margulisiibacteriota bacterium]